MISHGSNSANMAAVKAACSAIKPDSDCHGTHTFATRVRSADHHRSDLAQAASRLYPPDVQVTGTSLIAAPSWLPAEPVDLGAIDMTWVTGSRQLRVTGGEPETEPVRPLRSPGKQFDRYTSAIRYLDSPALFENRPSYRLHGLAWAGDTGAMRFGVATYFDKLDISEAVGHELAAARMRSTGGKITPTDLPFRSLIGNPFDFGFVPIPPAAATLIRSQQITVSCCPLDTGTDTAPP